METTQAYGFSYRRNSPLVFHIDRYIVEYSDTFRRSIRGSAAHETRPGMLIRLLDLLYLQSVPGTRADILTLGSGPMQCTCTVQLRSRRLPPNYKQSPVITGEARHYYFVHTSCQRWSYLEPTTTHRQQYPRNGHVSVGLLLLGSRNSIRLH